MDQGGQGRNQMDAAFLPLLRRQRRPASASCARRQSWQFPAHAGAARTDQGLAADEPQKEADQDRREGRQSRPLRRLPDGRGCDSKKPLRRHPAADRGTAATAGHVNSVTSSICHAFHEKPRETCVSMTENSAISAFGLTSVRPDTLRKRVGGGPRLLGTPNSRSLGLNRRPYGECGPM